MAATAVVIATVVIATAIIGTAIIATAPGMIVAPATTGIVGAEVATIVAAQASMIESVVGATAAAYEQESTAIIADAEAGGRAGEKGGNGSSGDVPCKLDRERNHDAGQNGCTTNMLNHFRFLAGHVRRGRPAGSGVAPT